MSDARLAFRELALELDRRPTGKQFAQRLGVSERTVWRYLRNLDVVSRRCPHCQGTGLLRERQL